MEEILKALDQEFQKETEVKKLGQTWCDFNKEVEKLFMKHLQRVVDRTADDGK